MGENHESSNGQRMLLRVSFGTEAQQAHHVGMEPHEKRTYLAAALREPEIRRACRAVDRIITAGDALDHMSPTTLEVVRDYCAEQTKGTMGTFSEFRQAWVQLVVDHLNDARTLERRLYHGITGRGVPALRNISCRPAPRTRPSTRMRTATTSTAASLPSHAPAASARDAPSPACFPLRPVGRSAAVSPRVIVPRVSGNTRAQSLRIGR
jgi:hypothetical protein